MKKNKTIFRVILTIAIVLLVCGLGYICWYLFNIYTSGHEYENLQQPTNSPTEKATESTAATGDTPDAPPDNVAPKEVHDTVNGSINFTKLWEINTDLYAWIKIPNTAIDYPVAQYPGDDDSYYLNHNMYKESAFAGCIYTEKLNKKDFSDPNTVLYGHNMQNGTMFRALHSFRDKDFFDANMDLLDKDVRNEVFNHENPVYTKLRDEMPSKYGFDSKVENSLIAEGCTIEGEVKNSIIFRGVKIGKGARVENCIIMQSGVIGDNTQLDYVVADKNVEFKDGRTLMGCRSFPMLIGKGLTV